MLSPPRNAALCGRKQVKNKQRPLPALSSIGYLLFLNLSGTPQARPFGYEKMLFGRVRTTFWGKNYYACNLQTGYNCPASTSLTTRSVRRSTPLGSYFFFRLAPKTQAKAW